MMRGGVESTSERAVLEIKRGGILLLFLLLIAVIAHHFHLLSPKHARALSLSYRFSSFCCLNHRAGTVADVDLKGNGHLLLLIKLQVLQGDNETILKVCMYVCVCIDCTDKCKKYSIYA